MSEKKTEDHRIVCVGHARLKGNKLRPLFREIIGEGDDASIDARDLVWECVKHAKAGNVYTVITDAGDWNGDTRSIYPPRGGRPAWSGQWHDKKARAMWEGHSAHIIHEHEMVKRRSKEERGSELDRLLMPIARVYRDLPWQARASFITEIGVRLSRLSNNLDTKDDNT